MASNPGLRRGSWILRLLGGMFLCTWTWAGASAHLFAQDTFTVGDAREVLKQVSTSLIAHNPRNMLGAFDITQMQDGTAFRQQTLSFFNQTAVIRVHFNGLRAGIQNGKAQAEVAIEMEAEMRDDRLPVLYKQSTLHLDFEKTTSGWRITAITPRDFFTTRP